MGGPPIFCLWRENLYDGFERLTGIDLDRHGLRARGPRALRQGQAAARVHRQAGRRQRGRLRGGEQPSDPRAGGRRRRLRPAGGVLAGAGPAAEEGSRISCVSPGTRRGSRCACRWRGRGISSGCCGKPRAGKVELEVDGKVLSLELANLDNARGWCPTFERSWSQRMSREILLLVDALAREKNVEKETVFGALELALASATKKRFNEDVDIRAARRPRDRRVLVLPPLAGRDRRGFEVPVAPVHAARSAGREARDQDGRIHRGAAVEGSKSAASARRPRSR